LTDAENAEVLGTMSAQFGICSLENRPLNREYLSAVRPMLSLYGPDAEGSVCQDNLQILYRALYPTQEARRETQPYICPSGAVITWDGRLDNRDELAHLLMPEISRASTAVEIVGAGFERFGTRLFARLVGDWALSIWDARTRALILARDFVGTRQLYYFLEKDQVRWCTILDPLLTVTGHSFELNHEYIAGWLGFFPAASLTPYVGIFSVPPSSFVALSSEKQTVHKYWEFDAGNRIRHRSDADYEQHFRDVFANAVRRRLRSDRPVVAELSGGMDSSAIVCMADRLISDGSALAPRLCTLSYYDNSEPSWNELPYVAAVETKRGDRGYHIDASSSASTGRSEESSFYCLPGGAPDKDNAARAFADVLVRERGRTVLSGLGGDEVLGGVPTPNPELQDLIVRLEFRRLCQQLKAWALSQRRPWFYLLWEALRDFAPPHRARSREIERSIPWLLPDFKSRFWLALSGYEPRLSPTESLPSFQQNLSTLEALRRHLACATPGFDPAYEKVYPYLDRELVEFCFAIPRDQLVRPGRRRFLQRNALQRIVPAEILERRKSFVVRGPMTALAAQFKQFDNREMITASLGILDPKSVSRYLGRVRAGEETAIVPLMRLLTIERWLHSFGNHLRVDGKDSTVPEPMRQPRSRPVAKVQLALAA
jgi:asparagine synthase (glutamine-hydrolysing)